MRATFTGPLVALTMLVPTLPAGADPMGAGQGVRVAQVLAPPGVGADAGMTAEAEQRYPWLIPRSDVDRPDERAGRQVHVVYLVASDMTDNHFDERGFIEDSMRSQNVWMKQQTGDQQWRLDTFTFEWDDPATPAAEQMPVSAVDVTFIASSKPSSQLNGVNKVDDELIAHGLNDPSKRYLSYVAANAGGVCGDAWYPISLTGGGDGKYSNIYLYSTPACRSRDFAPSPTQPSFTETIAMQEMVHNDGMVPLPAPHDCLVSAGAFGHVCTGPLWLTPERDPEATDVMFPYVGLPLNQKFLDMDHIDYYRHPFPYNDLEQSPYLETV